MNRESRTHAFERNPTLEALLAEINDRLNPASNEIATDRRHELFPKLFVHGALRSGTTMFMQWLARTGLSAYPTNLLSRFYGAPLAGARIQQVLTDPRYNFRDEIVDFNSDIEFRSENGKTKGALSPNEFWYFWRRFLPFGELDYASPEALARHGNLDGLRDELNALANIFEHPFALKAMIMNQNIPELAEKFDRALFVHVRRDPIFNIQSALEARRRQHGDMATWYSFRIREYPELKDLPPLDSVARQIAVINQAVEEGMSDLPDGQRLEVDYEAFCGDPKGYFQVIAKRLEALGALPANTYQGPPKFSSSNQWRLEEYSQHQAELAWQRACEWVKAI